MKYFQIVGDTTDQVAKKILKDYNGRAYIIKLVKEVKQEEGPKKWYHRMGFKPPQTTKFYYRAYCSLPEDQEDLGVIQNLSSPPSSGVFENEEKKVDGIVIQENKSSSPHYEHPQFLPEEGARNPFQSDILSLRKVITELYETANKPKKEELFLPFLLEKGFSYNFSQNFLNSLQTNIEDKNILKLVLKEKMKIRLPLAQDFFFEEGRNYLFLGPTGVGKTTTLAKMAALCYKEGKKGFRFVSFDSYRLGADEQLRRFADIFEKPFELIQSSAEMKKLVKARKSSEILFLDTAGESIQREVKLSEVMEYVQFLGGGTTVFLVLSVHSKIDDLFAVYKQFQGFSPDHFIITKIDETSQIGNILEFLSFQKETALFYTDGQSVPDDIKPMGLEKFFEYI